MNSIIKIIFVIVMIFSMQVFSQECKSLVSINTNDPEAIIYIDNEFKGAGFIEIFLHEGSYEMRISRAKNQWGSTDFVQTIDVVDCNINSEINVTLAEEVFLRTIPEDVNVFAGDSLIGHTPLWLAPGNGMLSLRKKQFEDMEINAGNISSNKIYELLYTGNDKEKSFVQTDIFKILIGSIVALGAATAYFKIKADKKFENYRFTRDQKYLDETRKLDLISGITFGALQINFGALIYFFLAE